MSDVGLPLQKVGSVSDLELSQSHNAMIDNLQAIKAICGKIRMPNTAYRVGDVVYLPDSNKAFFDIGLGSQCWLLRCKTAGTTGSGALEGPQNATDTVDGTCVWEWLYFMLYDYAAASKLTGIQAGAQVNTVTKVANKTGDVTLTKSDVSLGNVDNTSDANKPVSTAQDTRFKALEGKHGTTGTFLSVTETATVKQLASPYTAQKRGRIVVSITSTVDYYLYITINGDLYYYGAENHNIRLVRSVEVFVGDVVDVRCDVLTGNVSTSSFSVAFVAAVDN